MTAAEAQLRDFSAKLDELGGKNVSPVIGLDDSRIVAALDEISVKLDRLDESVTNVRLELEDGSAVARLDEISLKLDDIGSRDVSARLSLDDSGFNRQLDEDMAKLSAAGAASSGGGGGLGGGGLIGGAVLGGLAAAPALPGALTGGGAAIGTLGLAVQGIGPALSAYTAAQTAAATATGKTGAAAISAASQIHSAQQAVTAAETTAAHDAITSAEAIKNAQTAVAQATSQAANARISATEQVTRAEQQVDAAEQQLANAQYAEKTAQQALTDARQQAIITLEQLNNAEADSSLSAEQAQLDLEQAQLNAAAVDKSATATALQKAQADLSVREAQQRLTEAIQAKKNAADAANKADKEGVNGLPAVVAAAHGVQQAQQGVAASQRNVVNAHQSVADAQRNLATVEQQGAASIAKAQQSLADAVRNASWQQQGDALSVSNAQYRLHDAYAMASAGGTSAATAAAKYAYALSQLSPGGRAIVKDIIGLKSGFDSLKSAAQGAIAPGFTEFLKGVHSLMPVISAEVGRMGDIIGGALAAAGHAFQTSGFQATLKELFVQGNQFLQIIGPAIGTFLKAFGEAGAKSGDAVTGLAKGLAAIVAGLGDLMTNLAPAAPAIGAVLQTLGQAVGAIGGPLGTILGDLMRVLDPLLASALPLFKTLLGDIVKAVDPLAKALLPPLRATLAALAAPLQQGGTLLGQMASAVGQVIIALLPLLPSLTKLAVALLPIFIQQFQVAVPIIRGVAVVLAAVVTWLGPVITWITSVIAAGVAWITNLHNIESVMGVVAGALVAYWNGIYANVSGIIGHLISFFQTSWNVISGGVKTAYNAISSFIAGSWNTTYKSISGIVGTITSFLSGSWNKMVTDAKNIWNGLTGWITGSLAGAFKNAFQGIVNGIADVWNTLQNVVKVPINFLISKVYDGGIVPVVDAVAGLIGMHPLSALPGLAAGGRITAGTTGTADDVLARVSKNETVVSEEHSRILTPAFAALGVPGYATGGVPNPIGFVQHEASSVWKSAMAGLRDLTGDAAAKAAHIILDPLVNAMPGGGTPLGADIKKIPEMIVNDLIDKIKGATAGTSSSVGGGSGADVAKYAAGFATGHGHPYVWGGSQPSGWDCSGASAYWYEHFGYFPESPGTRHGTSQSQFSDPLLQSSGAVPGALAFFNGSDGPIGHVGIALNPTSYVSAYDTAEGTVVKPSKGALGYRIPKGGFQSGIHMSPANAQAWMSAHMKDYGWSGGEFGALKTLWNGECVTLDTMILTRRGWLDYTEVRAGDETIGHNPATGCSEWTRIERVVHYSQQPIWRFGNKYWSVKCTPNHRWLAEDMGTSTRYGPRPKREILEQREVIKGEGLVELQHLRRSQRVVLARPMRSDSSLPVSTREAALLGWIAGDGTVQLPVRRVRPARPELPPDATAPYGYRLDGTPKKNRSGRPRTSKPQYSNMVTGIRIGQAKPEHFDAIEDALSGVPDVGRYVERRRHPRRDVRVWRLSTEYSKDLLARAGHPKADAVKQVLAMSDEQREAWLDAIIAAEGNRGATKTVVYQNDGPVADAIELAIYLSGKRPGRTKAREGQWAISVASPHVGGLRRNRFLESAGSQDVWCVTTTLGTWTAQQEGHVFLTGNSGWRWNANNPSSGAYGIPQSLPGSKMASVNADWHDDAITQMKWGSGYIKNTKGYGTPSKTLALWNSRSPHWYDEGGWMPPGLSLTMNGTGRPEPVLSAAQWDSLSSVARAGEGGFGMVKYHRQMERVIHLLEQAPARTAGGVGGAINGAAHSAVQRAYFRTR